MSAAIITPTRPAGSRLMTSIGCAMSPFIT
jgi:hypothetical protein